MTVIYLGAHSSWYQAAIGVTMTVTSEEYTASRLFKKYKHELQPPTEGYIHIYKGSNFLTIFWGSYASLQPGEEYKNSKLASVDVYVNRFDSTNSKLLVVFYFENENHSTVENKYYPYSEIGPLIDRGANMPINSLCKYTNEESILCDLIQENDRLNDVLTYDIMQRPNGDPCTYNCNKIEVTDTTKNGQPTLTTSGEFTRFKHTPKNGHGAKPACIVYNCNTLLDSTGKAELEGVQGQQYKSVTVYLGEKARRKGVKTCTKGQGSSCPPGTSAGAEQTCPAAPAAGGVTSDHQDVPLMIALDKGNGDATNGQPDYYVHRRKKNNGGADGDTYYWVKLNGKDTQNGLKQLLSEIGLETASNGLGTSSSVHEVLGKTANGSGPTYLTLLLKRLEFDLTDSVVILLDKKDVSSGLNGEYGDEEIQEAISTLQPGGKNGNINLLKLNGENKIKVTNANNGTNTCLTKHKYRVVQHDFTNAVKGLTSGCHAGLRFLIPTSGNGGNYRELKIYEDATKTDAKDLMYIYYTKNGDHTQNESKVYVVFYQGTPNTGGGADSDPRPLLLCYQNQTYKPKDKDEYEQTWVKVPEVTKCLCQNGSETTNGENKELLKAVTGVVGFLNTVNLWYHPGPSTSTEAGGQGCTTGTTSGVSGATCQADQTTSTDNTCTYEVHQFNGSKIKVKVTCSQVDANGSSCYRKLTHQPMGTGNGGTSNGAGATNGAKGFRLGDVEYCPNGGPGRTGTIDYYGKGTTGGQNNTADPKNKWNPLVKVTAYFYNDDTKYSDPLLVVLEFSNGRDTDRECYRLTKSNGDTGLAWANDPEAKKLVSTENGKLVAHLDGIRYCLKKIVKVELQHNQAGQGYALLGRKANGTSKGDFTPINGTAGGGKVTVCQLLPCPALSSTNYICVKHNLTTALSGKQHKVAGLVFTLPGQNGDKDSDKAIEIPLGEGKCAAGDAASQTPGSEPCPNGPGPRPANGQAAKITYNQCMGDVCVYFYDGTGSGVEPLKTDTVPLMLQYNKRFYRPETRDNYFTKWVCVPTLATLKGDCGCSGGGAGGHDGCQQLVNKLNEVNLALNRIDLYSVKAITSDYGLPESGGGHKLDEQVSNVRVKVVKQKGPKQPPGDATSTEAYTRVVHRTKNGFQIGEIMYNKNDIKDGITPNGQNGGDTTIRIANGTGGRTGHKEQVNTYKWNTVVVYYSCSDKGKQLPQLIVILKTDAQVESEEPVKVSGGKYGYYVLATKNGVGVGGSGYEYEWRLVNGTDPPTTGVELNDETDFLLLNSGVILLEQRDKGTGGSGQYGEVQISTAVNSANLKSPGNEDDVNRLKDKNIKVTDETSTGGHKCLDGTGFKVMEHKLYDFANLFGPLETKLRGVKLIMGLRFLIPTQYGPYSYSAVKLCPDGVGDRCSEQRHYHKSGTNIRVFFYGNDPRPLLLCCNGVTYKPKDKGRYFEQWYKDSTVIKCVCNGADSSNGHKEKLLKALVSVVGFLNKVELQKHPGMAGVGACQNNGAGGQSTGTQCQAASSNDAGTCNYTVHTYNGSDIKVQVKCEAVPSKANGSKTCYRKLTHQPIGTGSNGSGFRLGDVEYCPNSGTGRKGTIDYYGNGPPGGQNNTADPKNKWNPLVKVTAYFYNDDTKYCDPLLVVLEFANGDASTDKECYRLKSDSGNTLTWQKDQAAKKLVGPDQGDALVRHLDAIRYCLKKVVKVELRHNQATQYALVGRKANGTSTGQFDQPINNGETVTVQVAPCPALSSTNYICVKHNLTTALSGKQHKVAGLAFTLPCENGGAGSGNNVIEIPLYNGADGQCAAGGESQTLVGQDLTCSNGSAPGPANGAKITYNQCMGDVCVYFYHGGNSGGVEPAGTDTVPLMLRYDNRFYRPETRDNYFTKWVCVPTLCTVDKECCCSVSGAGGHGGCQQLVKQLNKVNLALNRIDLYSVKAITSDYGLPESGGGHKLDEQVSNVRVKVVKQKGPKQPPGDATSTEAYTRVVHRTKNGFQIGEIMYNKNDIKDGLTPEGAQNGEGKITVSGGNHKDQVIVNSWNTVAVYYSFSDTGKKLPQLIVILKTDKPVSNGSTVTGSADPNTKYGYYILASRNDGGDELRTGGATCTSVGGGGGSILGTGTRYEYQYRWVNVNGKQAKGVKLDDATDFSLLNAAVVLLNWTYISGGEKCTGMPYGDAQLQEAVRIAARNGSLKVSPGSSDQVNRLQHRDITVKDETNGAESAQGVGTCPCGCKCLKEAGFKMMSHDLTQLVKLNGQFTGKLCSIALIAGLKLLTPTRASGQYKQLTLSDNVASSTNGNIKYHQDGKNKICVYFYDKDPRPLLVCYNGWAYRPKSMTEYDEQKWTQCKDIEECSCTKPSVGTCDKCPLLKALVRVSDFLNTVRLDSVPRSRETSSYYYSHGFNGQRIMVKIEAVRGTDKFCYNRYTHEHYGIGCGGEGFRLGNIHYKGVKAQESCIKLNNNGNGCINSVLEKNGKSSGTKPCETASHVVVFYYKHDKNHEIPIVVAMCTGTCPKLTCNLYYVLKNRAVKKYEKKEGSLTMNDDKELTKQLDAALFTNSKQLQVILDRRPVAMRYSATKGYPENVATLKEFREAKEDDITRVANRAFEEATKAAKARGTTLNPPNPEAIRSSLTHHVLRETSYEAQLCDPESTKPVSTPSTLSITVKEVDCHKSYTNAGYRCFRHLLTTATGIDQVGGLKLCLWVKDGGGQGTQATESYLTLCTGDTAGRTQTVQLRYTTCKGDLYLF